MAGRRWRERIDIEDLDPDRLNPFYDDEGAQHHESPTLIVIVLLLIPILGVLLFGREAVLSYLQTSGIALAVSGVVALAIALIYFLLHGLVYVVKAILKPFEYVLVFRYRAAISGH